MSLAQMKAQMTSLEKKSQAQMKAHREAPSNLQDLKMVPSNSLAQKRAIEICSLLKG